MRPLAKLSSLAALIALGACSDSVPDFELRKGDHICLIGNTLADRMQHHGWLETILHSRFPDFELTIRNLGFSGDEVAHRIRSTNFGSPDDHLTHSAADVVFAFFGYNESYGGEEGLPKFERELEHFLHHTLAQHYNGTSAPRIVLFSPVAHEDLDSPVLPDGSANNARLEVYTAAMREVAQAHGVRFVDLFAATKARYAEHNAPLTINGVHLTEVGNRELATIIEGALFPGSVVIHDESRLARIREVVLDKNLHWFNRYRTTDGYSIFGVRGGLRFVDGQTNHDVLDRELQILDQMTANRDRAIWAVARGQAPIIDDSNTEPFVPVVTNKPGEGPDGAHRFLGAEEAISKMTVAEGMKVELFASEEQFPEFVNPVQTAIDPKGRLWVALWPTYPHWQPKQPMNDKLVILPDEDRDGRADECIVFADDLHNPTGFEFWNGGVLVAQVPDLVFLKDTDGDDRADVRERVLHGLDSADTHHSSNSFVFGPGGALYFQEGTFHHTQVETPYGPTVRCANAGVFRYEPRTQKFDVYVSFGFANPHGHVFDRWGHDFVTDGTGAIPYHGTLFSGHVEFPRKHPKPPTVYRQRTRPCAGTAILSSRHFPDELQGNWLVNNVIGFQGILQYRFRDDGSSFGADEVEPIVFSSDPNFRPTDMEIGADGALYFSEWQNPIIGHMQHNLRDPSRDKEHGRVYRVTYPARPLLQPAEIAGAPTERLVRLLAEPEDGVRYRAKLELSARPTDEVIAAVDAWAAGLETVGEYQHHLCEALWLHQHHDVVDVDLLKRVLELPDFRARAAGTRVLCYWRDRVEDVLGLLRKLANDEHPRVRLEAVRACSFIRSGEAASIALETTKHPLDRFSRFVLRESLKTLEPYWQAAIRSGKDFIGDNPEGLAYILDQVEVDGLIRLERKGPVCRALLRRPGIELMFRKDAVRRLAQEHGTAPLTELLNELEHQAREPSRGLGDVCFLLASWNAQELATVRDRLTTIATESSSAKVRQAAIAASIVVEGSGDVAFERASRSAEGLRDLLLAIPLLPDKSVAAGLHESIRPLMFEAPAAIKQGGAARAAGVEFAYYEAPRFPNVATETLDSMQPKAEGRVATFTRDVPGRRPNRFAVKLSAWIDVPADGEYTFFTTSDDGSRLYVDDGLVVDNDGDHGNRERSGTVALSAGPHRIVVTYYDQGGNDALRVMWQGAGFGKRQIPPDALTVDVGAELQRGAIAALGYLPGHDAEKFSDFAGLIERGAHRNTAIRALLRTSRGAWPVAAARELATAVVALAADTPIAQRDGPTFGRMVELSHELLARLPADDVAQVRSDLAALNLTVIRLSTVPTEMRYDKTEFTVTAGRPVQIVFENPDHMPHNLLIVKPGTTDEVGRLAERMGVQGLDRDYHPDSDAILHATRLIQYGESVTLSFIAPAEPGDYGYVCTFPGHYQRMRGIMRVE